MSKIILPPLEKEDDDRVEFDINFFFYFKLSIVSKMYSTRVSKLRN